MPSIRDLYTFYLTAEHLQGRSHVVHIHSVSIEELWNRQTKRKEHKLLLRFHGKKLLLACNKTQATQIERITGTDDYSKWPGHTLLLSPGKAPTGAATITITAAPAAPSSNGKPAPAAAAPTDQAEADHHETSTPHAPTEPVEPAPPDAAA
jgi:hypothetical protein